MGFLDNILNNVFNSLSNMNCTINGERLKELREKHGYSRAELAEKTYTTIEIIQGWEEGWACINPSSGEISIMAELFNISEEKFRTEINADEENDFDYEDSDDE